MNNKTIFGKTALVLAIIYLISMLFNNLWGAVIFVRDFWEFIIKDASTMLVSTLKVMEMLFEIAIVTIWVIVYFKNSKSLKAPITVTCIYMSYRIIYALLNHGLLNADETISDFFKIKWSLFIIAVAWAILRTRTEQINRILFAVIRAIPILIGFPSIIRSVSRYAGYIFTPSPDSSLFSDVFAIIWLIVRTVVYILFLIWILAPKLFEESEKQQVD